MTPSAILRRSDDEKKQTHFLKYKKKEKGGILHPVNFHHSLFLLLPKSTLVLGTRRNLSPAKKSAPGIQFLKTFWPCLRSRFIEGELGRQLSLRL